MSSSRVGYIVPVNSILHDGMVACDDWAAGVIVPMPVLDPKKNVV